MINWYKKYRVNVRIQYYNERFEFIINDNLDQIIINSLDSIIKVKFGLVTKLQSDNLSYNPIFFTFMNIKNNLIEFYKCKFFFKGIDISIVLGEFNGKE